jgi:tetratricopeptide (TPR) repeat protein
MIGLLFIAVFVPSARGQNATIAEETRTFPTYPFSDPSPVPMLASNPLVYPYFAYDGFSHDPVSRPWKVVRMENPYIRVFVMPEIGGKIWGAVEKKGGREFIYMNDAVKFRQIALRGPWTSGGVEFNFGVVGHTPSTATPVDYALRTNRDGSVTCFVGSTDLPSRTRWSMAIRLPRDAAYVETRALWHNGTPYNQSYYTWTTAAVAARDDLRYFYTGPFMIGHAAAGENDTWPVDRQGRDLSSYKENRFEGSKSLFVFGSERTTFGTYAEGERLGLGHWALHDDMPGQKVWIWSLFRDGAIWENLLTDRRGQYSEPQAGRLLSQVDHEFFPPHTLDRWREIWFPVAGIGGLSTASPEAALHLQHAADTVWLRICALRGLSEELVVRDGGKVVFRKAVTLRPLETFHAGLTGVSAVESLQVSLGAKLRYAADPRRSRLSRPLVYRLPKENSPEGLYQAGLFYEKQRMFELALERYAACLAAEPDHLGALCHAAALYGRRGEPETGLAYAGRALTLSKYDPESNYWYGVLARGAGRPVDARETFGWAARSAEFRSSACGQIAEIHLGEGNAELAAHYADRAIEAGPASPSAALLRAVVHRKQGETAPARRILDRLLTEDPLNHAAAFERALGDPARFPIGTVQVRTEIRHETYLEAAVWYAGLGCTRDALSVLGAAPRQPMVLLWSAYLLRGEDPARSARLLKEACALSADFVFPFREESLPVLQWAASRSGSWKPAYYRSLLLWGKGRTREALDLMSSCAEVDEATFFLSRGLLKARLGSPEAGKDFEKAVAMDAGSWRNRHALTDHLARAARQEAALASARAGVERFPDQIVCAMDLASALYATGDFAGCLRQLSSMRVLPYEGSWEGHDLFVRANLELALGHMARGDTRGARPYLEASTRYPEELGTGQPFEPDVRLQEMLLALCDQQEGGEGQARRERAAAYTRRHKLTWGQEHAAGVLSLLGTGNRKEGLSLLEEWGRSSPADPMYLWTRAAVDRNVQSQEILKSRMSGNAWFRIRTRALDMLGSI